MADSDGDTSPLSDDDNDFHKLPASSSSSEDGEDGSEEILQVPRSLQVPSGMLLTPFCR